MRRAVMCLALAWAVFAALRVRADDPNACDVPGQAPDLLVGDISQVTRFGGEGGVSAYGLGEANCNRGTCWANWATNTPQHPVMGQNLFRLFDGRFEQIGQAWVRHEFFALSHALCTSGCLSTDGSHLGRFCSTPNSASLMGAQQYMGRKSEVNASTGVFPFPQTGFGQTGPVLERRLQVADADLDPQQNSGALWFGEVQLVAADDAAASNAKNNASWRQLLVAPGPSGFTLSPTGATVGESPAIEAWKENDPEVVESWVHADGWFVVAARATDLGDGRWSYEYAIQNLDSHRSAGSFAVPLPFGANVSAIGFHDVHYHSGEAFSAADWPSNGAEDFELRWATVPYDVDPNANALRWGTLYNFRFVADVAPTLGPATLGLFRPGSPSSLAVDTLVPTWCDGDAVCDPGESCTSCPTDCAGQGGGSGCCGDAVCDLGETSCSCLRDCGGPPDVEFSCSDALDDDCDGLADCADVDCCAEAACAGADVDGDGYQACDCDDADASVWARPGEVGEMQLGKGAAESAALDWAPPAAPGGSAVSYETIRSPNPLNFMTSVACLSDADASDTSAIDADLPPPGQGFYYVVRAANACPAPSGTGGVGRASSGAPRAAAACP